MKRIILFAIALFIFSHSNAQNAIKTTVKGSGKPVLLLPGFASDHTVWDSVVTEFNDHNELHLVNYAGFGQVQSIDSLWLPRVLKEIKSYIAQNNSEEWTVVGHSMGGTIATWLAAQENLNIKQVVVIDGLPGTAALMFPGVDPSTLTYDSPYNNQMLTMTDEQFNQMAVMMAQGMTSSPEHQNLVAKSIKKCDRKTYVHGYTDYLKLDVRPLLKQITVPVTIIAAGLPYGVDAATQTYKKQYSNLKNYDFHIKADSKHFIMYDAPNWLNEKLHAILDL
ncbi:alpha/beta hydrolase [Nonlabens sp. MIC269]|uniref:alpha/beta fold hydrolase n=1 Tax=Nonlabens sp. MIC269 TaxID=1476901 RepID=UPI00071ECDC3|nr:alpha/beta hydrolase [Nonlabens sp. MIC269]ALM21046.1 alpha/beta hydrolase [Nonlabens sp. MIC269]